ncbi:phosphorylase b kinase gamma catalytic chain, skeletal muscle/heart isoform-like isoform X2 [Anopheles albimanus]|uniref:phosphorylase b kinase gamma catalytic chain, skeletal muscle/heart isoform-like isoform X2 n=1 Tax=Anopheles albimanus TaxID=7167 RepID=UPI00163ECEE1|nr:phosphorylase b kinase gamma catalytic chain, skeletal muscle/heart isoform-like isoform X2 [Anopheles albimanus]
MAKDEEDDLLPDKDAAKGFYAKYEPKEILGRGISSTVRRCIDKETGKEYAAKIIDLGAAETGDSNHMLEATRQEIQILRQVMGHKFIIELQDVFESDAFIFLVFELCRQGELFDYLTSVVTLSEKKSRYIMRQIFEGVDYIHSKNIVHRDLKPENILLDDNLNVKITDFGFARVLKTGEKLYDLCGTPGYLAPETLKCNMFEDAPGYSREVDIWACGVIMFTLLVGCPPFWHRKQMVMLRNIMEGKYSFTSPEWADISEDPKDLIRKCLVVDPTKRITVTEALKHPFFNTVLFEQDIGPLKRSLSVKSRRFSRIADLALTACRALKLTCITKKRKGSELLLLTCFYLDLQCVDSAFRATVPLSCSSLLHLVRFGDTLSEQTDKRATPAPCTVHFRQYTALPTVRLCTHGFVRRSNGSRSCTQQIYYSIRTLSHTEIRISGG